MGVGINFALLKDNLFGGPNFVFSFLKGKIKVYEIKTKLEIVNAIFNKQLIYSKIVFLFKGNYPNTSFSILPRLRKTNKFKILMCEVLPAIALKINLICDSR